jgi:hypothetical protein
MSGPPLRGIAEDFFGNRHSENLPPALAAIVVDPEVFACGRVVGVRIIRAARESFEI